MVGGVTILAVLLLWMKFQTTDTFMLIFNPEAYFEVEQIAETVGEIEQDIDRTIDTVVEAIDYSEDIITQEYEIESETHDLSELEEIEELTDVSEIEPEDYLAKDITSYALTDEKYYAYTNIREDLKPLYLMIYEILATRGAATEVPTTSTTDLQTAFRCVVQDHPELFYVNGYDYSMYMLNDVIHTITFRGQYELTVSEIEDTQVYIDDYVEQFMAMVTVDMDNYDKVKLAYEIVILNTTYDSLAENNQDIRSVFLYRESVCQGYAEAFQYLLQIMDIPCMVVSGYAGGEAHAWNLVQIDGAYYYTDATWGDGLEGQAEEGQVQNVNYNYLNLTSEVISRTHDVDTLISLPYATSMEANYYVREGFYLEELDTTEIQRMVAEARGYGRETVAIKCADAYVYEAVVNHLFANNHVFDYLSGDAGTVNYYVDDDYYVITIYL